MTETVDLDKAIVALLRLAVAEREERVDPDLAKRKTELLLHESGLDYGQIAAVTGKKANAVRMAIKRAEK
jgi:DNA-directed RNA polymerase specialized sigma24 family protein